jgi:hypothetical protein
MLCHASLNSRACLVCACPSMCPVKCTTIVICVCSGKRSEIVSFYGVFVFSYSCLDIFPGLANVSLWTVSARYHVNRVSFFYRLKDSYFSSTTLSVNGRLLIWFSTQFFQNVFYNCIENRKTMHCIFFWPWNQKLFTKAYKTLDSNAVYIIILNLHCWIRKAFPLMKSPME